MEVTKPMRSLKKLLLESMLELAAFKEQRGNG
jgi:hypothetical protein